MTHTKREAFHRWQGVEKEERNNEGVIKAKILYNKGVKPRKAKAYVKLVEVYGYPVETNVALLFMSYIPSEKCWCAYDFDSGMPVFAKKTDKDTFYNILVEMFSHEDAFLYSKVDIKKMRKTLGKKLYPINKEG